jgi:hypothetical protein
VQKDRPEPERQSPSPPLKERGPELGKPGLGWEFGDVSRVAGVCADELVAESDEGGVALERPDDCPVACQEFWKGRGK